MIERENTEIAKLQRNAADFAALAALVSSASSMAAIGQKLIAMADQITEGAGVLAERTGHTVEDVCWRLRAPRRG